MFKFKELTRNGGHVRVVVDPTRIAAITEGSSAGRSTLYIDGDQIEVDGTIDEVMKALAISTGPTYVIGGNRP